MPKPSRDDSNDQISRIAREQGVKDTITLARPQPALAHWTAPVGFKTLDLSKYNVLSTKVFGECRVTLFARRDRTTAYLLVEGDTRHATKERLDQMLRLAQIVPTADAQTRIGDYLSKGGQIDDETCAIVIAMGRAPKDGLDSQLTWHKGEPLDHGAGKERDDGSVDYRERQTFIHLKKDDHILSVTPPTRGEPGADFQGNSIPARDGEWRRPLKGNNVRSDGSNQTELYAMVEGVLDLQGDHLSVRPMLQVYRVDFSTGNIRYSGDVTVMEGVSQGFEVAAEGNLTVGGDVTGAKLAGGQVIVDGRLVRSEVVSAATVGLSAIESSTVRADGAVMVTTDAVNLKLDCGGRLTMPEGKLIGGVVNALGGVEAGWIGGDGAATTLIRVDPDSCLLPMLDALSAQLAEKKTALEKLNTALAPLKAGGQAAINKLGTQQRDAIKQLMEKASALEFEIDVAKTQRKKLLAPVMVAIRYSVVAKLGFGAGVRVEIKGMVWECDAAKQGPHKVVVNAVGDALVCEPTA